MTLKQIGSTLIYTGVCIIMGALVYMIINIASADNFICNWAIAIGVGTFLSFWGSVSLIINKRKALK